MRAARLKTKQMISGMMGASCPWAHVKLSLCTCTRVSIVDTRVPAHSRHEQASDRQNLYNPQVPLYGAFEIGYGVRLHPNSFSPCLSSAQRRDGGTFGEVNRAKTRWRKGRGGGTQWYTRDTVTTVLFSSTKLHQSLWDRNQMHLHLTTTCQEMLCLVRSW